LLTSYAVILSDVSVAVQDDYRLPEGMKRVGYDSDSGRYYFRDRDGVVYEGGQGAKFGEMTRGEFEYIAFLSSYFKSFRSIWCTSCDIRREFR
jgi:hypothetical protein